MNTYFRITAYHKEKDFSAILDCYDMFEEIWQFSVMLIKEGFNIIKVGTPEQFLEGNTPITEKYPKKIVIRATQDGQPTYKYVDCHGTTKKAICVNFKYYVPEN